MDLPWNKYEGNKLDHSTQIGVICNPSRQVELKKFCECHIPGILKFDGLKCTTRNIGGIEYYCVYTDAPSFPRNELGTSTFGQYMTGNCVIYIRDTDMNEKDVGYLFR